MSVSPLASDLAERLGTIGRVEFERPGSAPRPGERALSAGPLASDLVERSGTIGRVECE